jgi:hypothetical protein
LPPLSEKETKEYIGKRLGIAGARAPIFTEEAMKQVYLKSRGIPRLINILCDNALLNGYALDQKRVDARSVREVAKDLSLRKLPRRTWILVLILICIAVSTLLFIYAQKSANLLPAYEGILRGYQYIKGILSKGGSTFFQFL